MNHNEVTTELELFHCRDAKGRPMYRTPNEGLSYSFRDAKALWDAQEQRNRQLWRDFSRGMRQPITL